jgi:ATP-dependent DNA helicase RecQ
MLENQLQNSFAMTAFRIGQREIIDAVLKKQDALAVLPTGAGKSLCYQFPAVYLQQLVIVVSPLIALMKDQVTALHKKGIAAGCLYSSQSQDEKRTVFSQIEEGGAFVLYLSPERVQKEGFQKWILNRKIALFAIDEAHCVSQWGHDFREEYSELRILKTLRPDVPVLALTASATPAVLDDVAKNLKLVNPQRLVHGFYRPNLYYQVEICAEDHDKTKWLMQALKQNPYGRVLVYCGTRKITEELADFLQEHFEKVGFYHAGLQPAVRTQVQTDYQKGNLRVLVATNAFGMGIDQPDVRLVVHYQMPANIDSLYQEMGRAGRDGAFSTCLMLYSKKDKGLQSFFIQNSKALKAIKDLRWKNLEALVSYAEGGECRHAEILTYYKDAQRLKRCGHCDVCDPRAGLRIQKIEVAPVVKKASRKAPAVSAHLSAIEEGRFQVLRQWRKRKADELDIPAFVIFGDKTLKELAQKNPQSIEDLKSVYGIGEAKLEKFGWDLIAEMAGN